MVVYEFMPRGSLNYHLFSKDPRRLLPWEKRVKVAVGMARGLSYLHTRETPIIYRDFKSSNILLGQDYTPKISDFGLAKWGPAATDPCVTSHVVGTVGYVAPEYHFKGNLYVKSDVYSFGVVLVEMLTGLRAIDKNRPPEQRDLVEWTKPLLSVRSKLKRIMDTRLEGKYAIKEASKIAVLAVKCLHQEPQFRPSMKEVTETLEQIGAYYKV
uniref:Protein kinase domain-containing protein n=1 Tax=Rhizophora mucronata TaxID=61149 RepID=A0A2P2Q459_RHIMU